MLLSVPSMFEGEAGLRSQSMEESEASVAVSADDPSLGVCPVCRDTFSQFFNHDTDDWHYRNAVSKDGLSYHPSCHADLMLVSTTNSLYLQI